MQTASKQRLFLGVDNICISAEMEQRRATVDLCIHNARFNQIRADLLAFFSNFLN